MMRSKHDIHEMIVHTAMGDLLLRWRKDADRARVHEISLPVETGLPKRKRAEPAPAAIREMADLLTRYFAGETVEFPRDILDWSRCTASGRRILEACGEIPRGMTVSYGEIAKRLGMKSGARAVGQAMANNPFPPVIPCHRVIRSDGSLGGFGGGIALKKRLLLMERRTATREFAYILRPTRKKMLITGATDAENRRIAAHFQYLRNLTESGTVLMAGRSLNTDRTAFGIVVFRCVSEPAARLIMDNDPAVRGNVMTARLLPWRTALLGPCADWMESEDEL